MRVLRKLAAVAVTLVATSFVIFGATYAAPGDPAAFLVGGPDAATPQNLAAVRAQYHLDEPLLLQYGHWASGVLHGDLGRSFKYNDQVLDLLTSRLSTTLLLGGYAAVLFVVLGVALGTLAAVRRGPVDATIAAGTTLASSVPPFVVAIAAISVFGVRLGWFPVSGGGAGLADRLYHLTLPAVALALAALAIITRVTRQSMIEQFGQDHVEAARGSGVPEGRIVVRHVLRGALGPVVTMCGLVMAGTLAGTVVIETAFGLSGIGSLLVTAINTHDFPVAQAVLLFMVVAYITVTTLVDLAHPLLDPRVRGRAA
jgi:peptide/nickel transport system permease protein